ncbi:MAG: hypothetical protein SVS85_04410 [Candidatus Nanohaloarchaea archaeon]|nr:hypothetical protein [Candidatus Nanohaloarchaea archaeon]
MEQELEECSSGGYKIRLDPNRFEEVAEQVREEHEPEVDTDQMLVFHIEGVKCSFVRSSGRLTVRTEDRGEAEEILERLL